MQRVLTPCLPCNLLTMLVMCGILVNNVVTRLVRLLASCEIANCTLGSTSGRCFLHPRTHKIYFPLCPPMSPISPYVPCSLSHAYRRSFSFLFLVPLHTRKMPPLVRGRCYLAGCCLAAKSGDGRAFPAIGPSYCGCGKRFCSTGCLAVHRLGPMDARYL